VDRLWLKWRQVRLALRPCSSYHRMTLSLWRALVDRPASARVWATAMGSSLDTTVAPGRIAPYTCMGTPYLPRLMTHYGVWHVSGRVQAVSFQSGVGVVGRPQRLTGPRWFSSIRTNLEERRPAECQGECLSMRTLARVPGPP